MGEIITIYHFVKHGMFLTKTISASSDRDTYDSLVKHFRNIVPEARLVRIVLELPEENGHAV